MPVDIIDARPLLQRLLELYVSYPGFFHWAGIVFALALPVIAFLVYVGVKRKAQNQLAQDQQKSLEEWVKDRN